MNSKPNRSNINEVLYQKLAKFFSRTLDKNNDGLVNWVDFQAAIEVKSKIFQH